MTLPLTPEMLEAAYEFLRRTPPFHRWKLPPGGDVIFKVIENQNCFGRYQWTGSRHSILASIKAIGHTESLMRLMAHEMIHLYLEIKGMESKRAGPNVHNAAFRRFAAQACRAHGFDPKAFY